VRCPTQELELARQTDGGVELASGVGLVRLRDDNQRVAANDAAIALCAGSLEALTVKEADAETALETRLIQMSA
jgi:hypothetical protein